MAYLVVVHVPYTDVTKSNYLLADEKPSEKNALEKVETTKDSDKEEDSAAIEGNEALDDTVTDTVDVDSDKKLEGITADHVAVDKKPVSEGKIGEKLAEGEVSEDLKENTTEAENEVSKPDDSTEVEETATETENEVSKDDDSTELIGDSTDAENEGKIAMEENPQSKEKGQAGEGSTEKAVDVNNEDDEGEMEEPLTPLFHHIPIHVRVDQELVKLGVDSVHMDIVGRGLYMMFSFLQEDSQKCEQILNRLRGIGVGLTAGSSMSVFPSSLHESGKEETDVRRGSNVEDAPEKTSKIDEVDEKKSQFRKSVKSRLLVAQVVNSVTSNALFTFDYLLLIILASLISCIALAENSSVVLVASMLISPLMGPILAATFGQVIRKKDLRNLGLKSELKGLALCLIVGFLFGLVSGGVGLHGAIWGSSDSWPTAEMKSRGMLRSLWVGVFIALPSGAGVAISVLGGNAGSLVGVAISASLLPPACNAGMLWAYSFLSALNPPDIMIGNGVSPSTALPTTTLPSVNTSETSSTTVSTNTTFSTQSVTMTTLFTPLDTLTCSPLVNNQYTAVYSCNVAHEAAILGLVSLVLTLLNIFCIILMGIIVLKIKEVAPRSAGVDTFWREDVHVARGYYMTAKGESSKSMGKTFLEEYKKLQRQGREGGNVKSPECDKGTESNDDESFDSDMAILEVHGIIENVENSPDCQDVRNKLHCSTYMKFTQDIDNEYNEATENIASKLDKNPGVYLANHSVRDSEAQRVYNTIHHLPANHRPGIIELRDTLKKRKAPSMYIDPTALMDLHDNVKSSFGLTKPTSRLFQRRKKVKFHVTKVDEEQELV